jgi:hypothetical protein
MLFSSLKVHTLQYCFRIIDSNISLYLRFISKRRAIVNRLKILAFACLCTLMGLSACDYVYKETGKEVSLLKAASPTVFTQAGQVITYTYVVTFNNDNPSPPDPNSLGGDDIDGSLKIVVTDAPLDNPVVCSGNALYAHESTTCTAQYTITERDVANGCVTNTAMVTGKFWTRDIYDRGTSVEKKVDVEHTVTATSSATVYAGSRSTCKPLSTEEAPSPIPSLPPALPSPTPSPTLAPILTGEVTYCNPDTHVMNLRLADGFVAQDFQYQVTMNDQALNCEINESNPSLLLCSYPPSVTFPAQVHVEINDTAVNSFVFDGASCLVSENPKDQGNDNQDNGPACTPLPGQVCP